MRAALLPLLLLALPLVAQDRTNRVSLFVSEPSFAWSEGGSSHWSGGIGLAFEHRFGARWSAEVSAAREESTRRLPSIAPGGLTVINEEKLTAYPVDVTARYHFATAPHTRWRPYAGAGVRWVNAPDSLLGALEDRLSPEVVGGVDFNLTPEWSLRADAKRLLRDSAPHDEAFKVSIGAGFRF